MKFERAVIVLEDSKTGRREIPISAPMRQLLTNLPRVDGNPYVFPGSKPAQPIVNIAKPWKRVLRAAETEPARLHDLRHTTASVGVASGASLILIGRVLGHKNPQTTERYAHLSDDPVRAVSEDIAERVRAAMDGRAGDVVPLPKRAG